MLIKLITSIVNLNLITYFTDIYLFTYHLHHLHAHLSLYIFM